MNAKLLGWGLVCGCLALLADTASAQRGMFGNRNTLTSLLRMEEVQKELKLEGDALEEVNEFVEEAQAEMREEFSALRDEGLEQDEMMAAMQKIQAKMAEKEAKELGELLSEEQMKRANQLLVQRMGWSAVTRDDVAKALGFSDEALADLKSKIAELDKKRNEQMREAAENQDREAFREITEEYTKNLDALVNETLSDEQKKAFEEFKGAAFKFPEPQRGGGGRQRNDF